MGKGKTIEGVIKSLLESSDLHKDIGKLKFSQIEAVIKNLLVSHKQNEIKNQYIKEEIQSLQTKAKMDRVALHIEDSTNKAAKDNPINVEEVGPSAFDTLFSKNVSHILEKIFLSLDYESFKNCMYVSTTWHELLTSETYKRKVKSQLRDKIIHDEAKLWYYSKCGKTEEVCRLLHIGLVNVNLISEGGRESTPLYEAADRGHKEVVQLLLNAGADPDKGTVHGKTPLQVAANRAQKEVVLLLLNAGADPDRVDHAGRTPIDVASYLGHKDVLKVLLDRGADPNKANSWGYNFTPLHQAAINNCPDAIKLLINCGADLNGVDKRGQTPLHSATIWGQKAAVQALLARGADPNKRDEEEKTPISVAQDYNYMDIADILNSA